MTTTTEGRRVDRLYRGTTTPQLLQVPPLTFLCLDGHGDPNTSPAYAAAVQALYSVSYAAKFAVKKAGGPDFNVSPLEGLWWAEDMSTFLTGDKAAWEWTMMIRQPDAVTGDLLSRLTDEVAVKKSMPAARQLRLVTFEEGTAAQALHVGPYATEAATIARLHDHPRARVHLRRPSAQAPRDLPRRSTPVGSGKAAHHHQAAILSQVTGSGRSDSRYRRHHLMVPLRAARPVARTEGHV